MPDSGSVEHSGPAPVVEHFATEVATAGSAELVALPVAASAIAATTVFRVSLLVVESVAERSSEAG